MKRIHLIIAGIILVVGTGSALIYAQITKNSLGDEEKGQYIRTSENGDNNSGQTGSTPTTLRLVATGDMIAHDSVNANAKHSDGIYDYLSLMSEMKPFFEAADIRFCNQSTPAGGADFGVSGYPVFNAPLEFTRDMVRVGCNLVNIGTNHTNDKGQTLIDATVRGWAGQNGLLAYAGANENQAEQNRVRYFELKGVKFAFLSYVTYTNKALATSYGVNMWRDDLVTSQVKEANAQADIVIVSMRWGTEYSPNVNADQTQKSQTLADLGADIILGHGPHVLEPVRKLKGKGGNETLVWYSLGNFLNTQLSIESLVGGFAIMDIDIASKKVADISFLPVYMHYEWTPEEKRREDLLARKNLSMHPLDKSADYLAKSQNSTTVKAQTERVRAVLNTFTQVRVVTSEEY